MTSRERILAVLEHHLPDKIPWIPVATRTFFLSLPDYRRRQVTFTETLDNKGLRTN